MAGRYIKLMIIIRCFVCAPLTICCYTEKTNWTAQIPSSSSPKANHTLLKTKNPLWHKHTYTHTRIHTVDSILLWCPSYVVFSKKNIQSMLCCIVCVYDLCISRIYRHPIGDTRYIYSIYARTIWRTGTRPPDPDAAATVDMNTHLNISENFRFTKSFTINISKQCVLRGTYNLKKSTKNTQRWGSLSVLWLGNKIFTPREVRISIHRFATHQISTQSTSPQQEVARHQHLSSFRRVVLMCTSRRTSNDTPKASKPPITSQNTQRRLRAIN